MSEQLLIAFLGGLITIAATVIASFIWWLIKAILKNTTELAVLNSKIESIISDTKSIPKIQQDLKVLHAWRKSVEGDT